jgi:hypothetical protein
MSSSPLVICEQSTQWILYLCGINNPGLTRFKKQSRKKKLGKKTSIFFVANSHTKINNINTQLFYFQCFLGKKKEH